MAEIELGESAIKPTAPSLGKWIFYPKADGFYMQDDQGVETKIGTAIVQNVFGENFQEAENEIAQSVSTLTPTTYLTLVTPSLPLGHYRVGYNFSWSYDDQKGNAGHIALYDNGVRHNITDITMETKNIFDIPHVGSFLYLDNISGVHTLELKFNCDNILDIMTMKSAYIEFWRVP